ncbi:MAG: Crp/Fnr family transcriptional regulator [Acidobacteriota bacterium]|nr:Crp/Fnr family transcriptional regulator [Acidobacteriota bacterium]
METLKIEKPATNRLLAALPEKDYQRLLPRLEQIDLIFGEPLFGVGDPIRYVYFPQSGVVSIHAVEDEATLEVGLVGNEGMIGLPLFLEVETSRALIIAQSNGTALRMQASDFLQECKENVLLSRLMRRYTHYLLMQITQTVICTRLHLIESRLACLLLMMHDRMMTNEFKLKQEFLSKVLGVRREAVSIAASNLQQQQLISYSRGNLSIVNREGLEAACCRCYKIVTQEYKGFLAAQSQLN